MNKKYNIIIILTVTIFIIHSNKTFSQEKNKLEDWYTYWGLGASSVTYPGELNDIMNELKDTPGINHISIALDLLGFYFPTDENTILGGIVNAFGDRYEEDVENMQINGYLYSFSVMHFLQNRIGKGIFIRGDIGFAKILLDSSFEIDAESDWGFGFLIGGGFGFVVSPETRILITASYANRKVENENWSCLQISLGGLF